MFFAGLVLHFTTPPPAGDEKAKPATEAITQQEYSDGPDSEPPKSISGFVYLGVRHDANQKWMPNAFAHYGKIINTDGVPKLGDLVTLVALSICE